MISSAGESAGFGAGVGNFCAGVGVGTGVEILRGVEVEVGLGVALGVARGVAAGRGFGRGVEEGDALGTGRMSSRALRKSCLFSSSVIWECRRVWNAKMQQKQLIAVITKTEEMRVFQIRTPQASKPHIFFKLLGISLAQDTVRKPERSAEKRAGHCPSVRSDPQPRSVRSHGAQSLR